MLSPLIGQALDPSLRVLVLPLRMLDATPVMRPASGLPAGALDIAPANLILAATPCEAPLFREQMRSACAQSRRDVLLVHTGLFPETIDPVTVDAALTGPDGPMVVTDLSFMRAYDARLWLVPQHVGPFIEVRGDGLVLETLPPFLTWDERCDGVCRAAAEIVRIVTRRRGC
jgi:hypothetical protein